MLILDNAGAQHMGLFAFGDIGQGTRNFLQEQATVLSDRLTQAGQQFMQRTSGIYEQMAGSEAMRLAKAAIRTAQYAFQADCVRELMDIAQMQQAPLSMQRWIMANPVVREMYHAHRCDGYSDTYVDMQPGYIGEQHDDYRTVMNGMVTFNEDPQAEVEWTVTHYYGDECEELTYAEQLDVLNTWERIERLMSKRKEDPTSPWAANL